MTEKPTVPGFALDLEFTADEIDLMIAFIETSRDDGARVRVMPSQYHVRDSLERKLKARRPPKEGA